MEQGLVVQILGGLIVALLTGWFTKNPKAGWSVLLVAFLVIWMAGSRRSEVVGRQNDEPGRGPSHPQSDKEEPTAPTTTPTHAAAKPATSTQSPRPCVEGPCQRFEDVQFQVPEGWRVSVPDFSGTASPGSLTLVLANEMASPTLGSPRTALIHLLIYRMTGDEGPFNEAAVTTLLNNDQDFRYNSQIKHVAVAQRGVTGFSVEGARLVIGQPYASYRTFLHAPGIVPRLSVIEFNAQNGYLYSLHMPAFLRFVQTIQFL